jgi:hypothetical protein
MWNQLLEVEKRALSLSNADSESVPDVLYHYTTATGAIGILEDRELWMTDVRCLNDRSELKYGEKLVQSRIARYLTASHSPLQKMFLERISSAGVASLTVGSHVFVVSFCQDGDLLSQWRAYADRGQGYSLGFDLFHLQWGLNDRCRLVRLLHDSDQQEQIIERIITVYLEFATHERYVNWKGQASRPVGRPVGEDDFCSDVCNSFANVAHPCSLAFKDPSFREEHEWRIVFVNNWHDEIVRRDEDIVYPTAIKFRANNGRIVPYVSLSFRNIVELSLDTRRGWRFPVVEAVIGPTVDATEYIEPLEMLLMSHNRYQCPNIRRSNCPLREVRPK